jgi:hypothetical protein
MKMTAGVLPQALEFEHLQAVTSKVDSVRCLNRKLYSIKGLDGIFRRVPRSGSGLTINRLGGRLATFGGSIIELLRDLAAESELREAGFTDPASMPPDRIMVSDQQGQELREAGLRMAEVLDQPEEPKAGQSVPDDPGTNNNGLDAQSPPETDGEGLTAAEILAEQRRQANHEHVQSPL